MRLKNIRNSLEQPTGKSFQQVLQETQDQMIQTHLLEKLINALDKEEKNKPTGKELDKAISKALYDAFKNIK